MNPDLSLAARVGGLEWPPVEVAEVELRLIDDALPQPVQTSFGTMRSRPGLLVRLTDARGVQGFGEVWCNFPQGGARYKATLLAEYVRPALWGTSFARPQAVQERLRHVLEVLALQCGDRGAIEQLIAGVDQAAWDLFCKRRAEPFWRLLGGEPRVPVYASGIGPRNVSATIAAQRADGHTRFKIKLGFGDDVDEANLGAALAASPAAGTLMVDVNQGWSLEEAARWLPRLAAQGIVWCEEPVPADTAWSDWRALAAIAPAVRLAAGENLLGVQTLTEAISLGGIRVLQPDLGKWGGITGNLLLRARWPDAEAWLCPHWLSGGVGLAASLQFKAAVGGPGPVELDANPNRQRSEAFAAPLAIAQGSVRLPYSPGLVPPLAAWLLEAHTWTRSAP